MNRDGQPNLIPHVTSIQSIPDKPTSDMMIPRPGLCVIVILTEHKNHVLCLLLNSGERGEKWLIPAGYFCDPMAFVLICSISGRCDT